MSGSTALYKAVRASKNAFKATAKATGHGIAAVFNSASGNNALKKKGIERGISRGRKIDLIALNEVFTGASTIAVTCALAATLGPLVIPVAAATLLTTGLGPARIHAALRIGKHDTQKAEAEKQAKANISQKKTPACGPVHGGPYCGTSHG